MAISTRTSFRREFLRIIILYYKPAVLVAAGFVFMKSFLMLLPYFMKNAQDKS